MPWFLTKQNASLRERRWAMWPWRESERGWWELGGWHGKRSGKIDLTGIKKVTPKLTHWHMELSRFQNQINNSQIYVYIYIHIYIYLCVYIYIYIYSVYMWWGFLCLCIRDCVYVCVGVCKYTKIWDKIPILNSVKNATVQYWHWKRKTNELFRFSLSCEWFWIYSTILFISLMLFLLLVEKNVKYVILL